MSNERLYNMAMEGLYPAYVAKAEKKQRTKAEVDEIIEWLLGYDADSLDAAMPSDTTVRDFFDGAPALNSNRDLVTGVVCGVRVEEVDDPLMKKIRQLDKMIDELAKGKPMEKILRA